MRKPKRDKAKCVNCGWREQRRRLRCGTCANYLDAHGHDRPISLVIAAGKRA